MSAGNPYYTRQLVACRQQVFVSFLLAPRPGHIEPIQHKRVGLLQTSTPIRFTTHFPKWNGWRRLRGFSGTNRGMEPSSQSTDASVDRLKS